MAGFYLVLWSCEPTLQGLQALQALQAVQAPQGLQGFAAGFCSFLSTLLFPALFWYLHPSLSVLLVIHLSLGANVIFCLPACTMGFHSSLIPVFCSFSFSTANIIGSAGALPAEYAKTAGTKAEEGRKGGRMKLRWKDEERARVKDWNAELGRGKQKTLKSDEWGSDAYIENRGGEQLKREIMGKKMSVKPWQTSATGWWWNTEKKMHFY